ncbi:MAG: T9SS type A sorting domain-containing protein, partial [Bacteroidales bacterium]
GGSSAAGALHSFAFSRLTTGTINLKNNIFSNSRTGGTGKHIAISTNANSSITSNYNDLYASTAANVGSINGGTAALDFATWKSTVTGQDVNSVSVDPAFISATDLHTAVVDVNNKGVDVSGITTDYSGATRTSPPDMGAYEFALNATVATVTPLTTISTNGATLLGTVNANNESATGTFEYGLTDSYGSTAVWTPSPVTGTTATDVSVAVASLQPNTLYHYRINATTPKGTANGSDQTFTTTASASCTFLGGTSNDWADATNWDNGLPGDITDVTIPANKLAVVNPVGTCNNLTIAPLGALTVTPGIAAWFTVKGNLLIESDATGTGSFIYVNGLAVDGTITMERYMNNADWTNWQDGWHLIGSPVASQAIDPNFTGAPYDLYCWYEPVGKWVNFKNTTIAPTWNDANTTSNFTLGKGYMAAYDNGGTKEFAGSLNVADVTFSNLTYTAGTSQGYHLLSNPFSSAITWYTGWSTTNIGGVAKIWNEDGLSYSSISADGIIPATQGFMVLVSSGTNSITIPAANRTHSTQAFYKNSTYPIISLVAHNLDNPSFQENQIRFNPASSQDFDFEFDGEFLPGYAPEFYTMVGDTKLDVNSLPVIDNSTSIPIHFIKNEGSNFSINAKEISNLAATVYLLDNKTNIDHNLTENPIYLFTSETGDASDRFVLHFGAVGIDEPENQNSLQAYVYSNRVYVTNTLGKASMQLFDLQGRLVQSSQLNGEGLQSQALNMPAGVYVVRLSNAQIVKSV